MLSNSSKKNLTASVETEKLILLPPSGALLYAGEELTVKIIKGSLLSLKRVCAERCLQPITEEEMNEGKNIKKCSSFVNLCSKMCSLI